MRELVSFGAAPWERGELIDSLAAFASIYKKRPIKDNHGGMGAPHLFAVWSILRKLKPTAVIESGVFLGQGTWLIENACPSADIYSIDINLSKVVYKSSRAQYFGNDFSVLDWSKLPVDETVLLFDDHQNAYERLKQARWFNFRHLIFEDNYPPDQGDCYSLKKAFAHQGHTPSDAHSSLKQKIKAEVKALLLASNERPSVVPSNAVDSVYLRRNLDVYQEFPPVFHVPTTRWGTPWDKASYPTPESLLKEQQAESYPDFFEEARGYNWLCYARLK